jgi:Tfp pilus assembly protein PilF
MGAAVARPFRAGLGAPYRLRQPPAEARAMLTDRYDLRLSTASTDARDAYVLGCEAKLTMYPGAIEAFDRAIAADPAFALPHAARAHALLERGDAAAARESIAAANARAAGLPAREASHIAFFGLLVAGDSEAALTAVQAHLNEWPRDALVLGTTAFTNGLIGSSGRGGQKRTLLALLDRLAPYYGDDWWFTAHHGMALSENGPHDAARPMIERSLAQNSANPWAAHATAHLAYERGEPGAACEFLTGWLTTYPRNAPLFSHLSWHLAIAHLESGDAATASRLFGEAFAPEMHSGPPRGKLNDVVSYLWRRELAGQPRDAGAWRAMHDFAAATFPRAGAAFSDLHVVLTLAVAGDDGALAARVRQIEALAGEGRYPSGACVPAVARGFAAFEHRDFAAAIEALEPVADELERIGGSHAQLDLVRFTLLRAYLGAERAEDARRALGERRPSGMGVPVAGLAAAHWPALSVS